MNIFRKVFWLIWFLSVMLLILILFSYHGVELIFFLVLFALVGDLMHSQKFYKQKLKKIADIVNEIDISPIEDGIKTIEKKQSEYLTKISDLENEFEKYKIEQEKKYRDVVRKVLNIDNELNKKFKTLGECVLRISRKLEEKE